MKREMKREREGERGYMTSAYEACVNVACFVTIYFIIFFLFCLFFLPRRLRYL